MAMPRLESPKMRPMTPVLKLKWFENKIGHGGPVESLELDAQTAAPQRQTIRSVCCDVVDLPGHDGKPIRSSCSSRMTVAPWRGCRGSSSPFSE